MKQSKIIRISVAVSFLAALVLSSVPALGTGQQSATLNDPKVDPKVGSDPKVDPTLIDPKVGSDASTSERTISPVEEQRRTVQESSQRIAKLVRLRPTTIAPNADQQFMQEVIDIKIAEIRRERAQALEAIVLADNPGIQAIDRERGLYRVPVQDGQGQIHWFSGRIPAIWHLHQLDPAVFTLADPIRARPQSVNLPPDTRVSSHLLVGGTSAQSTVHPFPGDIDYDETFVVHAPTPAAAGQALAAIIAEFVSRTDSESSLEFDTLRIMPLKSRRSPGTDYRWSRERILDPSQRAELARQLASVDRGRVNTDWRALVAGGRYIVIGKIFGITAFSSVNGEQFFATEPLRLDFQVLYFGDEVPATHPNIPLGNYASHMMERAKIQVRRDHYLKAAKRTFNFCRAVGDLECTAAVIPIFNTPEAEVYHSYKVLEAIAMALDPETPSRILLVSNAREQILNAANVIEANLPVVPGTIPERPKAVAEQLREIAAALQERKTNPVGVVEPDIVLAERMKMLLEVELISMVRLSLKERVEKIVDTYVR